MVAAATTLFRAPALPDTGDLREDRLECGRAVMARAAAAGRLRTDLDTEYVFGDRIAAIEERADDALRVIPQSQIQQSSHGFPVLYRKMRDKGDSLSS